MKAFAIQRALCAIFIAGGIARNASALDRMEAAPPALANVDLHERLGAKVPLATTFTKSDGSKVRLADVIGDRPVILTFNYSNCPMLCSVQLKGLVDAMSAMEWNLGAQYDVITISLDPNETQERAADTRARYLRDYGREGTEAGWTFLRGSKQEFDAVADAVGFGYRYLEEKDQYLHAAVLTLLSPSGSVSTYVYGVTYDPINLRDKLLIAGVGETSQALARFILSCYHYEEPTGNGSIVSNIMRYGGFAFLVGSAGLLVLAKRRRRLRSLHAEGMYARANQVGSVEDHV